MRMRALTVCAAFLVMGAMLFSADTGYAATVKADYLVLGDSISAGYGLSDPTTQSFPALLAADQNLELNNLAVSGNTMANLATTLTDKTSAGAISDEAIENADIISITAGGNDCMHALYGAVAAYYNSIFTPDITADDVTTIIGAESDSRRYLVLFAMGAILSNPQSSFADTADFKAALANYETNLQAVVNYIHDVNPDAVLFIDTQYNPYVAFKAGSVAYVYNAFAACVPKLNAIISDSNNGAGSKYQVVDVAAAFATNVNSEGVQDLGASLCNASLEPLNFDFHPNAAGHKVIASTITTNLGHDISTPQSVTTGGITATLVFSTSAGSILPTDTILPNVSVTATITFSGAPDSASNAASYNLMYSNAETGIDDSCDTKYLPAGQAVSETTAFTFAMPANDVGSFNLTLTKNDPIQLSSISIDATQAVVGTALTTSIQPAGAKATYQWYADDTAISGATASTYTPTKDDVGKTLTVKATGVEEYGGTIESKTGLVVKAKDSGGANDAGKTDDGDGGNGVASASAAVPYATPYTADGFSLLPGVLLLAVLAGFAVGLAARKIGNRETI